MEELQAWMGIPLQGEGVIDKHVLKRARASPSNWLWPREIQESGRKATIKEVTEENWQGRKCVFVMRAEIAPNPNESRDCTKPKTIAKAEKQTKLLSHFKKQLD